MTRIQLLLLTVTLAGCVTDRAELHKDQQSAYLACNRVASSKVAPQPGDPVSLAVAAVGMCAYESAAFRAALDTTYNPAHVARLMRMYEGEAIKANTSWIVQDRLRLAQR